MLENCGRVRTYRLAPAPLKADEHWMVKLRGHWERRFNQMDAYLKTVKGNEK